MKVYIVSNGKLNTGYEADIKCVCSSLQLAEAIQRSFKEFGLSVTEFEVIDSTANEVSK